MLDIATSLRIHQSLVPFYIKHSEIKQKTPDVKFLYNALTSRPGFNNSTAHCCLQMISDASPLSIIYGCVFLLMFFMLTALERDLSCFFKFSSEGQVLHHSSQTQHEIWIWTNDPREMSCPKAIYFVEVSLCFVFSRLVCFLCSQRWIKKSTIVL